MLSSDYKKHKKTKILLLSVIFITLSIVIVIFIGYRRISKTPEMLVSSIREDAKISIGKIHQTATRHGKKEWSLEASSAYYIESNNQLILKDLSLTFYLEDKSEVHLKASQGILRTDSNDIEVSGNVVMKNTAYRLNTTSLNYQHERRLILSNAPVTISGNSTELAADSISFDLNTKKLVLEGKVEAIFLENNPL